MNQTTIYMPSRQEIHETTRKIRASWSKEERQLRRQQGRMRQLKLVRLVSPQKCFPQYAA